MVCFVMFLFRHVFVSSSFDWLFSLQIRWWPATENIRKANDTVVPRAMSHGVVKGLEDGVVYALRVLAYSAGGDGKKSPTTYFTLG